MVKVQDIIDFLGYKVLLPFVNSNISGPWNNKQAHMQQMAFVSKTEQHPNPVAAMVIAPPSIAKGTGVFASSNPKLDFIKCCYEFFPPPKVEIKYGFDLVKKEFTAIGGEGFGYVGDIHFPHYGDVHIGHGVHIGSFTCIDRGSLSHTIIGNQVKIDNHVHIAHNVKVGNGTKIAAGAVICGSVTIGENCFIGVNSSILQGITVGNNVTIGAGAVVTKNVPDGETWIGIPAKKK